MDKVNLDDTVPAINTANMVTNPNHYKLFPEQGIEVLHIVNRVMECMDSSDLNTCYSSYAAGCFKEALQYLLRCYAKGGMEDIEKAHFYLTEFLVSSTQGLPEYCHRRPMPPVGDVGQIAMTDKGRG